MNTVTGVMRFESITGKFGIQISGNLLENVLPKRIVEA
jgi:hypothetical protein